MATDIDVTYNFNTPTKYTTNQAQVTGGKGQLALTDLAAQTFNQPFTSDTGFTYDSAKAEFTAGIVRQKDQRPANATFGATYTSSVNGNWGDGTLTGTAIDGATITGNRLDLTNGLSTCVTYTAVGNADSQQTGCVRFKYTPNYSGTPAASVSLFAIAENSGSDNNLIQILKVNNPTNYLRIRDNTGSYITNVSFAWAVTSGVTYEVELNWDITTGLTELYIDGTRVVQDTSTGTRNSSIGQFVVGGAKDASSSARGYIEDLVVFNAVQHTGASYTPGYTLSECKYCTSKVELPQFSYSDIGSLQAFTAFAVTESNAPRYVVNDLYWSGAAWVSSDGSWSQASSSSDVASNIGSLPASDTVYVDIVFNDGNSQMSVDDITVTYTGQEYYTSGTIVTPELTAEDLDNFDATETNTANTTIKYALYIDGVLYYWDGAAWSLSNGLDAQTNTKADFATNLRTAISTGSTIKFYILIQTSDKQETGEISTLSFSYDFSAIVNNPTTCIIWGYYRDISGNGVNGATVTFKLKKSLSGEYKEASGSIIEKQVTTTTRSNGNNGGYFEMPLVRSSNYEGTGVYAVTIEKSSDGLSVKKNSEGQALEFEAPDALDKDITELITAA